MSYTMSQKVYSLLKGVDLRHALLNGSSVRIAPVHERCSENQHIMNLPFATSAASRPCVPTRRASRPPPPIYGIYAIGDNREAAVNAGIRVGPHMMINFAIIGFLAALSAVVFYS